MKRDHLFLQHMLDALNKIELFCQALSEEDFIHDDKTNLAVARLLEIIGEAARHISDEMIELLPEIPWKDMVGLRNILIHEYFGVDLGIVWSTIKQDLPLLKKVISKYLESIQ
jgi:uncharacterized protein with HEPN domain